MEGRNEIRQALQSLRGYLQELLDSGVDGLPLSGNAGADEECGGIYADASKAAAGPYIAEAPVADGGSPVVQPVETAAVRETLADIREDLGDCLRCSLGSSRKNLVYGTGNPHAELVFVGEAPGRDEDLQGIPFVGRAGELLTNMILRMGFKREDVYICNVLKCRPPGNRNPQDAEIAACHPYLLRQLQAIGPRVIVALGTFAAQILLGTREPISKLRGRFHDYHGIPLMPTFHPSFLLRNGPEMRWVVWEDMVQVLRLLDMPVPDIKRKN